MTETARPFDLFNENGLGPFVVVCDHGGDLVPDGFASLSKTTPLFGESCDPGAERLARELAQLLDAPAVIQPNSRQVVDCARPPDDPAFVRNYGGVDPAPNRDALNALIVQPYYAAIRTRVAALLSKRVGQRILVVSVHTIADNRLPNRSVLLPERGEHGDPARTQALSVLREKLDKQGLLGAPAFGASPFAGEHLALAGRAGEFERAGGAAFSLIVKVAQTQAADPHVVSCVASALRDASKAAETKRWSFLGRRLPQNSRKLASRLVAAVITIGLVPLVTFIVDKWPEPSPQFRLIADQRLASTVDVPIGPSVTIRLARINPKDKTVSYPEALTCTPSEGSAVLQTIVSRGTEDGCTFKVTGSRMLFADSTAPQQVDFTLSVLDENKHDVAVPPAKLILHDVMAPTPIASADSVEAGRSFDVTLEPEPGGEDVTFTACTWLPPQYVLNVSRVDKGCRVTVGAPAASGPAKTLSLFARVTVTDSAGSFVLNSNELVVSITPRRHDPAPAIAAAQAAPAATTRTPPATTAVTSHPLASLPPAPVLAAPQSAPISPPASAAPPASSVTVAQLVDTLRDTRDNDRYLALRDGLATLDPGIRLSPEDAFRLLGSLSGNLRTRALTNWVLPRITTPMPAAGGEQLIASLAPFDRVALLHDLGGCALAPLTEQQQAQLLSGIFGVARDRATAALAARDGDCGGASTNGG